MTSITIYKSQWEREAVEAERKLIAHWLDGEFARRFPIETKFMTVHVALNQAAAQINSGSYRQEGKTE
jgi:hypothetical protein